MPKDSLQSRPPAYCPGLACPPIPSKPPRKTPQTEGQGHRPKQDRPRARHAKRQGSWQAAFKCWPCLAKNASFTNALATSPFAVTRIRFDVEQLRRVRATHTVPAAVQLFTRGRGTSFARVFAPRRPRASRQEPTTPPARCSPEFDGCIVSVIPYSWPAVLPLAGTGGQR